VDHGAIKRDLTGRSTKHISSRAWWSHQVGINVVMPTFAHNENISIIMI
jgi:hypothetical protein